MPPVNLRSKFRGALLETSIGDSLGRGLEGSFAVGLLKPEEIAPRRQRLRYTDDTQMMMGVAESLIICRGFNGEHMARQFVENYEPSRGYGPGSSQVIRAIQRGEPWNLPAKKLFGGSGSYGNGSSMRIAPIGLFYRDDLEKLNHVARASSEITHTHELGVEGAVLQALSVALATNTDPGELRENDFLEKLMEFTGNELYRKKLGFIGEFLDEGAHRSMVIHKLGNGIEAFNSVPTAIYCFLSHPDDFETAVLYAVGLGGDADTIGAMTGAITGAHQGENNIPKAWMEKLENCPTIKNLADKLLHLKRVM